jgi:phospholipase C
MTPCGTPTGAFAEDLANDTLPALSFVTPNLDNDMHNGTVTQGDNWLYTYMPLILTSKSYLAGEVVVLVLWDEQATVDFGGAVPNLFVSPYITAGTVVSTQLNHFATLRAMEKALGISTYLGCASGTILGGGTCAAGSTADLRGAFNF